MNIDWSKAPEDATHYSPGGGDYYCSWIKWVNGELHGWLASHDTRWSRLLRQEKDNDQISRHVERPKKQEAWNGEGLPPIGTVCEHSAADKKLDSEEGKWFKVEIIAHHKFNNDAYKCAVWVSGSEISYSSSGSHFRPIKTAEQVAAEEREKAISDMMEVTSDGISCIGQDDALALYKAGYRKQ